MHISYIKKQGNPDLELTVTVYNINWGNNCELMEACSLLRDYARYVEQVRIFAKEMIFPQAVEQAVDYCIQNGILADFLLRNRAEAIVMSIFEYNEERHLQSERKQAYNSGRDDGIREGETRLARLLQLLADEGRDNDIRRAVSDQVFRERLYKDKKL